MTTFAIRADTEVLIFLLHSLRRHPVSPPPAHHVDAIYRAEAMLEEAALDRALSQPLDDLSDSEFAELVHSVCQPFHNTERVVP